jgi:hypothetical protein
MATIGQLVHDATAALDSLAAVGESVEDEWQYVTDLTGTWRARLADVADARGSEEAPPDVAAAVARVAAESALIADPHRAIDWLSTLPQVVLVALDEAT